MILSVLLAVTIAPKITVLTLKSVTLNPAAVTGGNTVNGTVTLGGTSTQPVTVKISSSDKTLVEVPQTVVVQPGITSATFIAQTHPVSMNPNVVGVAPPSVKISAQLGNEQPMTATLTVNPATLVSVAVNPATIGTGSTSTGTVAISGPAPAGGMTVTLHSPSGGSSPRPLAATLNPSAITMPSSVTIQPGAMSGTFTITAGPAGSYEIDASWGAFITKSTMLTVTAPQIASLKLNSALTGWSDYEAIVTGGTAVQGRIDLTGKVTGQPITVYLNVDTAVGGTTGSFAKCGQPPSSPQTISVPVGASSATFTVTTTPGYGTYQVGVGTTQNFVGWKLVGLSTMTPVATIVVPSSAKGGSAIQGKLQLTGPAMSASCGNRYTLKSSNTTYVQVPAYVDVTPGATEATFAISSTALPASSANVTVTISVIGIYVMNNASPNQVSQHTETANLTITP